MQLPTSAACAVGFSVDLPCLRVGSGSAARRGPMIGAGIVLLTVTLAAYFPAREWLERLRQGEARLLPYHIQGVRRISPRRPQGPRAGCHLLNDIKAVVGLSFNR